jgi:hypothetical protein
MTPLDPRLVALYGLPRLIEFRWLGSSRVSFVAKDAATLAEAVAAPEVQELDAYLVINELMGDVASRRHMPLDALYRPLRGQCVADSDIVRHILLPFDFDPVRPTGTAATLDQIAHAVEMRDALVLYLSQRGWPNPAGDVFSGNGRHTYYRTDLPNTREVQLALYGLYSALAQQFDRPGSVKLDKSVRSPAQIMRLPGTFNHKAQRQCEIIAVDEAPGLVTLAHVTDIIKNLRGEQGYKKTLVARAGDWTPQMMESLLDFYDLGYVAAREIPQGILWVLVPCPFNDGHQATSSAVMLTKAGWPKFTCKHDSCAELKWADFRRHLFTQTRKWWTYDR